MKANDHGLGRCHPDAAFGAVGKHPAEGWLLAPDGNRVPGGPLCWAHAEPVIAEYRDKLGEVWGFKREQEEA